MKDKLTKEEKIKLVEERKMVSIQALLFKIDDYLKGNVSSAKLRVFAGHRLNQVMKADARIKNIINPKKKKKKKRVEFPSMDYMSGVFGVGSVRPPIQEINYPYQTQPSPYNVSASGRLIPDQNLREVRTVTRTINPDGTFSDMNNVAIMPAIEVSQYIARMGNRQGDIISVEEREV